MFSLANIITASNLFLGCVAICFLFTGEYLSALVFLLLASLADFMDGFVARKLHQTSEIGKQLDSLADVVSFGVAPGVVAFLLLKQTGCLGYPFLAYSAFLLPVFSAFRLARFNLESSGHNAFFSGIPTPAMALFFIGLLGYLIDPKPWHMQFFNFWTLQVLILFFSWLLVSRVRVIKIFLYRDWLIKNGYFILVILTCMLLWKWLGPVSISLAVVCHVFLSSLRKRERGNV